MKFPLWILAPLLALAGPAAADMLLGARVGQESLAVKYRAPGVSQSDTLTSRAGLGMVLGLGRPGGGSRLTAAYASSEISRGMDLSLLNVGYVQMLPGWEAGPHLQLRPFVGGELGYGWLRVDRPAGTGRDSGPQAGVKAGLNLVLTERAELELGLRYSRVGLEAELPGAVAYEVRDSRGWWLGFNVGL